MTKRDLPDKAKRIPENATKVFTGKIFDVYQWQQQLFDGSYETFEMLKRPDTVLVMAFDEHDNLVVVREQQPGMPVREMHLPGGRVDQTDETILAAAQREMREETGISLQDWKLVEIIQPEHKIEWFIYVYIARKITTRDNLHVDTGEKIEVFDVTYEEFRSKNRVASRLNLLEEVKTTKELMRLFDT